MIAHPWKFWPGLLPLAISFAASAAGAYPDSPIRWVIPFPAGGGSDIVGRVITHKLSEILGQQIVVDNRGGASGNIAAELVSRAAPDGYTVLMPHAGVQTINAALFKKLVYDPASFVPITMLVTVPNMFAVHPSVPVRSVKEYIALAKKIPGKLTFGSSGYGTSGHLANELLKAEARINTLHVPYKGAAPALIGLVSGEVDSLITNVSVLLPMVREGKVRPLAVAGLKRAKPVPNVPTIAESGLPGFDADSWYGLVAPAGTPPAIIAKLHEAVVQALQDASVQAQLDKVGATTVGNTPEQFRQRVRTDTTKWARIIKGIRK
jgi:tripartite-type tricarboxylate transporter receptor subunit TctC